MLLHLFCDVRNDAMRLNIHGTNTRMKAWISLSRHRFLGLQDDFQIYGTFFCSLLYKRDPLPFLTGANFTVERQSFCCWSPLKVVAVWVGM